ncbi:MAG: spore maturation protein [Firmicutes bacterium]|jgi:spore maturation protein B|nr:spore maturation protein [Bacillota bacterium]HOB22136.1 spore maturation protein [Bacillota bacterium]
MLEISRYTIPLLLLAIPLFAALRGVEVWNSFIRGAKGAFAVAVDLIPFLVGMLVAIEVFRASGALDFFVGLLSPVGRICGIPSEVLPLALLRPLSGSGGLALVGDLTARYGPESFIARLAATLQGSTETTFYVLAVYLGAVKIRNSRHTVLAALLSDLVGLFAATFFCRLAFF